MSVHARKKAKKTLEQEIVVQDGQVFMLPEETLLYIFKYLNISELIIAGSICKAWRRIAYDDELWKRIDLTYRPSSVHQLMTFFKRFDRSITTELRIQGLPKGYTKFKRVNLCQCSKSLCDQIQKSYKNLKDLYMFEFSFRETHDRAQHISCLPRNLESIHLIKCEMPMMTIQGNLDFLMVKNSMDFFLPRLQVLSFKNSPCITLLSVSYLPKLCPNLIELDLSKCCRISSSRSLSIMLMSYERTLRKLHLQQTNIDDDTIHCICRKLKRLVFFDIRECKNVTIMIVPNLCTLNQLQTLLAEEQLLNAYVEMKNRTQDEENETDAICID
ncbi:unnamed protein product [Didymodactylos carnosus]|uniref:F-box domain-containing protein n=1 Tax=Didymodactylos carnosus TaxID=1234261 RepID=A0A8S2KCV1_9BILA|nr:unnamed protein product [Didymodactylos carnosus]CAF3845908.1 unnamed protein product [Didymodactylos carnosus]